jgi:hypothetical protein
MLARIDGKSPVEYLTDEPKKQLLRDFVYRQLTRSSSTIGELTSEWQRVLSSL